MKGWMPSGSLELYLHLNDPPWLGPKLAQKGAVLSAASWFPPQITVAGTPCFPSTQMCAMHVYWLKRCHPPWRPLSGLLIHALHTHHEDMWRSFLLPTVASRQHSSSLINPKSTKKKKAKNYSWDLWRHSHWSTSTPFLKSSSPR